MRTKIQKRARKSQYKDALLKKGKANGGSATSSEDIQELVTNLDNHKLKSCLRSKVGFQKALHPFDAAERPHLYEMNFFTAEELTENLIILFEKFDKSGGDESIVFPSKEEIFKNITGEPEERSNPSNEPEDDCIANKPFTMIWDVAGKRNWWISFTICQIDDETIKVDHIQRRKRRSKYWIRGPDDQAVSHAQILSVDVMVHGMFNVRGRFTKW